jgi:hypothetical protein
LRPWPKRQPEYGPSHIFNAKGGPFIISEITFGQVPLQEPLADVVVRPVDAPLEDGEVAFDRVRMHIAANVLASAVIDGTVLGELVTSLHDGAALIRHHVAGPM